MRLVAFPVSLVRDDGSFPSILRPGFKAWIASEQARKREAYPHLVLRQKHSFLKKIHLKKRWIVTGQTFVVYNCCFYFISTTQWIKCPRWWQDLHLPVGIGTPYHQLWIQKDLLVQYLKKKCEGSYIAFTFAWPDHFLFLQRPYKQGSTGLQ